MDEGFETLLMLFLGIFILACIILFILLYYKFHQIIPIPPPTPPTPGPSPLPISPISPTEHIKKQEKPLRITNWFNEPVWVEARGTRKNPTTGQYVAGVPFDGFEKPKRLEAKSFIDIDIPAEGIAGTKFWAKWKCDDDGYNCKIGDQMQRWGGWNNPDGGCGKSGCTPPVDSIFEATWGCSLKDKSQCASNPSDMSTKLGDKTYFDTSQVDGYTFPYTVILKGEHNKCDYDEKTQTYKGLSFIDASGLDLTKCPVNEDLSLGGLIDQYVDTTMTPPVTYNSSPVDLRIVNDGMVYGCMSPCKKVNYGQPYGFNQGEDPTTSERDQKKAEEEKKKMFSVGAVWYCCPTPSRFLDPVTRQPTKDCVANNGCVTSEACNEGPVNGKGIKATEYYKEVKKMSDSYAFAYDDKAGLHSCPADEVLYEVVFGPPNSPEYPIKA